MHFKTPSSKHFPFEVFSLAFVHIQQKIYYPYHGLSSSHA